MGEFGAVTIRVDGCGDKCEDGICQRNGRKGNVEGSAAGSVARHIGRAEEHLTFTKAAWVGFRVAEEFEPIGRIGTTAEVPVILTQLPSW
jgi:hypothetical protein